MLNQFREVLDKNGKDYQDELETKAKKFNDDSLKMTPVAKEAAIADMSTEVCFTVEQIKPARQEGAEPVRQRECRPLRLIPQGHALPDRSKLRPLSVQKE